MKTLSKKDYIALCDSVCGALSQISHQLCGYKEVLDDESKKITTLYLNGNKKSPKLPKSVLKKGKNNTMKMFCISL